MPNREQTADFVFTALVAVVLADTEGGKTQAVNKISYFIGGSLMRCHDAAIILEGEPPLEELLTSVLMTISTDVEIQLGEKTIHLGMLLDPEQWSDDWAKLGVEDPYEFVAGLVAPASG